MVYALNNIEVAVGVHFHGQPSIWGWGRFDDTAAGWERYFDLRQRSWWLYKLYQQFQNIIAAEEIIDQ